MVRHIIQNLNSQVWTELKLFQDSNRYHLAKRLWYGKEHAVGSKMIRFARKYQWYIKVTINH